jgi:hypothetical protein
MIIFGLINNPSTRMAPIIEIPAAAPETAAAAAVTICKTVLRRTASTG